jgi:hypothetical protein
MCYISIVHRYRDRASGCEVGDGLEYMWIRDVEAEDTSSVQDAQGAFRGLRAPMYQCVRFSMHNNYLKCLASPDNAG